MKAPPPDYIYPMMTECLFEYPIDHDIIVSILSLLRKSHYFRDRHRFTDLFSFRNWKSEQSVATFFI